ncbi:MAG: hypothetical protein LBH55_01130 [Mycoplasmataceae bacterium]|jgi:hypothetical protein|nr:hypothetical protein [Mycoplasmataceae bacterium]
MILTEEQKTQNLSYWITGLNQMGIDTECIIEKYGNLLLNAPLSEQFNTGAAYEGALIDKSFRFSKIAKHMNKILPAELQQDENKIIKICLLASVGKAAMFVPCKEKWKNDRGILWDFTDRTTALRTNQLTLFILSQCGIVLDEMEYEAIDNLYSLDDDKYMKEFSGILASLVRMAYRFMWEESKKLSKLSIKNNNMF